MAKEFIRHLDYYGFPDQNTFTSEGNVDLSDIRKKNEEQDEAIRHIGKMEHVTHRELHEVDMKHTDWNKGQDAGIRNLFSGLTAVKEFSNDMADTVSAMNNNIESISGDISTINDEIEEIIEIIGGDTGGTSIKDEVEELSGKVESLSGEFITYSAETKEYLDRYADSARRTFARKDSVYTKDEIDTKLSASTYDMATKTWVGDNFVSKLYAEDIYAKKEDLVGINGKIIELSGTTSAKFKMIDESLSGLTNHIEDLSRDADARIDAVESSVTQFNIRVAAVENGLTAKADRSALTESYAVLDEKIAKKVDKTSYQTDLTNIGIQIRNLDAAKANQLSLDQTNAEVTQVRGLVNTEENNRITADTRLENMITAITSDTQDIKDKNVEQDDAIEDLDDRLTQEIQDRIAGDEALLGQPSDSNTATTIYGARKEAENQGNRAILEAQTLAQDAKSQAMNYTDTKIDAVEGLISGLATQAYVIDADNDVRSELRSEISSTATSLSYSISGETSRASRVENELRRDVDTHTNTISTIQSRLLALTAWLGTDPTLYDDSGNGVIDAMHREIHTINNNINKIVQQLRDNYNINITL